MVYLKQSDIKKLTLFSVSLMAISMLMQPALAKEAKDNKKDNEDNIIVTGSRIKNNFSSVSPISVITTEEADLAGIADIANLLQSATVAASSSQITSAISSAFVTAGGPGAQTVSLRGLGANRTLILLDGRRAGPAGTRGQVGPFDLNVLPQSIIQRADILKDGASSIYGSDAIAGVINLITRNPDGFEFSVVNSTPFKGGGSAWGATATYGKSGDRGNFSVTFDYSKRNSLKRRNRDFLNCKQDYLFDPNSNQRLDVLDPRTGDFKCKNVINGQIWAYDYSEYFTKADSNLPETIQGTKGRKALFLQYDKDGVLSSTLPKWNNSPDDANLLTAPDGFYFVNYDKTSRAVIQYTHPLEGNADVIPKKNTYSLFAKGDYQIGSNTEVYFDFLYNKRTTDVESYRQIWTYGYSHDWYKGGDPLAAEAGLSGAYQFSPVALIKSNSSTEIDYHRLVTGIRGDFGKGFLDGWSWDLFGQYSLSNGFYTNDTVRKDAREAQNFRTKLCAGTILPVSGLECRDVNFYTPDALQGKFSKADSDFLFTEETGNTKYKTYVVEGVMTGDLFKLPAGSVGTAIGAQYRYDDIYDKPGNETLTGNSWGRTSSGITQGSTNGYDIFSELNIPLLRDTLLAEEVTLNLSGRYTNINKLGKATTYKVGLNWQVISPVRIRASYGTSFRTPNLFERFLESQTSFLGQRNVDPCINWAQELELGNITQNLADNCAASGVPSNHTGSGSSATVILSGNGSTLEPETSSSTVVGVVFRPDFIDLNMSVDYFDIEIDNQIEKLRPGSIVSLCLNSTDLGYPNKYCSFFDRTPSDAKAGANLITEVRQQYINVAKQYFSGYDFAMNYSLDTSYGRLQVSGEATYTVRNKYQSFPGSPVVSDNGEAGNPSLVGRIATTFKKGDYTYALTGNYIGGWSEEKDFGGNVTSSGRSRVVISADPVWYHHASVRKELGNTALIVGIRNIMDVKPPTVTTRTGYVRTLANIPFYSQYDIAGRSVFVRLNVKF